MARLQKILGQKGFSATDRDVPTEVVTGNQNCALMREGEKHAIMTGKVIAVLEVYVVSFGIFD